MYCPPRCLCHAYRPHPRMGRGAGDALVRAQNGSSICSLCNGCILVPLLHLHHCSPLGQMESQWQHAIPIWPTVGRRSCVEVRTRFPTRLR